jgi:hypothetical protein
MKPLARILAMFEAGFPCFKPCSAKQNMRNNEFSLLQKKRQEICRQRKTLAKKQIVRSKGVSLH